MKTTNPQPLLIKTTFTGDSGVGKTSLLTRQYDDSFNDYHLATIGVDFRMKTYNVGNIPVKMQYWDTVGQQRFRAITRNYFKSATGICICFDLSSRASFENLPHWISQLESYNVVEHAVLFLIGCKSDKDSEVPTDQILLFAEKHNLTYLQTSSKTGQGITDAFNRIVVMCTQKFIQKSIVHVEKKLIKQEEPPSYIRKRCC